MSKAAQASEASATKKTLAIRLEASQHRQVWVLAQVEGLTVTDAIRQSHR